MVKMTTLQEGVAHDDDDDDELTMISLACLRPRSKGRDFDFAIRWWLLVGWV